MPAKKTSTKKTAIAQKTAEEKIVIEQDRIETFEDAFDRVVKQAIAEPVSLQLIPREEEQVEMEAIAKPVLTQQLMLAAPKHLAPKKEHPARPLPQAREQYDLNQVVVSGVIGSVWGKNNDVFARMALSMRGRLVENDDNFASHITLRFADGMIAGMPISIQPGDVLKIRGYLVHREYHETLRKFLDEANAMNFLDYVDPADLQAWRALSLERRTHPGEV